MSEAGRVVRVTGSAQDWGAALDDVSRRLEQVRAKGFAVQVIMTVHEFNLGFLDFCRMHLVVLVTPEQVADPKPDA